MMKKTTIQRLFARLGVFMCLFLCLSANALAYDAHAASSWMDQFANALSALKPVNDPVLTADPARAGEYLLEYDFGTVLSASSANPSAKEILEIDVRTNQVTDCRCVRVGMELSSALDGAVPSHSASPLYVLTARETGYSWSWAYMGENGVYGVEYIAYGEAGAGMKEYTLTYVIENNVITAIRMKVAAATLAQAQEGLETAKEIAARQEAELMIAANDRPVLTLEDLRVMGSRALGVPVAQMIAGMGEPQDIQMLPQGMGRVLVYDGAVVTLGFNEMTGEEIVRAVSVSSAAFEGPNRLKVGMSLAQAGALARCDEDIYSRGGLLYLEGEALGEAPYGELRITGADEMMLVYACTAQEDTALLQAIAQNGVISSWQMMYLSDMQGGI